MYSMLKHQDDDIYIKRYIAAIAGFCGGLLIRHIWRKHHEKAD